MNQLFKFKKPQKKLIVRLFGGMGNQMFSYAAARRLAHMSNCVLIIDSVSGFENDTQYNRKYALTHFNLPVRIATKSERLQPFAKLRRFILKKISKLLPFNYRFYIVQEKIDFDPRILNLQIDKNSIIEGYWQSEKYFNDIAEIIRNDFTITPPFDELNRSIFKQITNPDCESVAMHIRFFDDIIDGYDNSPTKYYQSAFNKMENLVSDAHYFIFSDKPDLAKEILNFPVSRCTFVNNNTNDDQQYADFWLMSNCKHFIIANSTFSWWAAWLSKNQIKNIIAPGFEKRDGKMWWGFDGLLPDNWIKI